MYEEEKTGFSIKNFILQILIVLLIIFLLMWIFPTKTFFNRNSGVSLNSYEENMYEQAFSSSIESMKEAAVGYFTEERLPKTNDKSVKLTLQEMYDEHLILEIKDNDGKSCDSEASYVEVTKYNEEYQMKVNLKCQDQEDYIVVYLENYCEYGLCSENNYANTSSSGGSSVTNNNDYSNTSESVTYYEYSKSFSSDCSWSDWSDWSTQKVEGNSKRVVQSKTEKVSTGISINKVQTGEKTEKYVSGYETERYVTGYKKEKVLSGTRLETYVDYEQEKYISGYKTVNSIQLVPIYSYRTVAVEKVREVDNYVTKKVPIYGTRKVAVYSTKTVPVYSYEENLETVTYYRYKDYSCSKNELVLKLSTSNNDSNLIDQGYTLTGNVQIK